MTREQLKNVAMDIIAFPEMYPDPVFFYKIGSDYGYYMGTEWTVEEAERFAGAKQLTVDEVLYWDRVQ